MIDEDPRFPNRRKRDWEEPRFDDEFPDAGLQDSNGEKKESEPLPLSGYRVIGRAPEGPGEEPVEEALPEPIIPTPDAEEQTLISVSAVAEEQKPASAPPTSKPTPRQVWMERIRKFAESPIRVYTAAGVGLGILIGIVFAVTSWFMATPDGRYDLGTSSSSETGLTGHLYIQWDKKFEYRLTLKPSDADRQASFALVVANPPRPLSIQIHLRDSQGFTLCSKDIILKYDARNAAALGASASDSGAGEANAGGTSNGQPAEGSDLAELDAQEAARRQGNDVFQNQAGKDGAIAAINAQGDFSCSRETYEKTASWSFTPNFPSITEQDELLKRQKEMQTGGERQSAERSAERAKKMAAIAAAKLLPFSMEGDDAIVDFDLSRGIMQTRGRKTFFVDKATAAGADPRWQDYPVSIHYRCDRSSDCLLTHAGQGSLRARLGR